METEKILGIINKYPTGGRESLIPLLQDVQEELGYLSQDAIKLIGAHLKLPASKIFGVATFYNQFRFNAPGKFHIQVCRGTACHVKGSFSVYENIQRELKIKGGETTRDGMFSLEEVACLGACGLAPVISVNGEFFANMDNKKIKKLIKTLRKEVKEYAE
ncbi:MAG: NAD(P)H-dependent oxidoreductase subunit E [Bacteroidota bacterium]